MLVNVWYTGSVMPVVRCVAAKSGVSAIQGRHAAATSWFAAFNTVWLTELRANH